MEDKQIKLVICPLLGIGIMDPMKGPLFELSLVKVEPLKGPLGLINHIKFNYLIEKNKNHNKRIL